MRLIHKCLTARDELAFFFFIFFVHGAFLSLRRSTEDHANLSTSGSLLGHVTHTLIVPMCERERDRQRDRQRNRDRERQRQRQRHRDRERENDATRTNTET